MMEDGLERGKGRRRGGDANKFQRILTEMFKCREGWNSSYYATGHEG